MLIRVPVIASTVAIIAILCTSADVASADTTPGPPSFPIQAQGHDQRTTRRGGDRGSHGATGKPLPCPNRKVCGNLGGPQPAAPHIATIDVVHKATDALTLPPPRIRTSPRHKGYVNVRTYLSVDPAGLHAHPAKASVPEQTVTATATPTQIVWNTGETTVTCAATGAAKQCGYTYKRSSANRPGGKYRVTATISWTVVWTCTGACDTAGGSGPTMNSRSSIAFPVGEIQAVN